MSAWSVRRRLIYLGAVLAFLGLAIFSFYFVFFRKAPSCFDGIKNQNELGVDCGGVCKQVCDIEVTPLIKDWTRLFNTGPGKYDVAALVENPNFNLGLSQLNYVFKLYDAQGFYITEKSGHVFVNARDKFIIFESGLDTGARAAAKATMEFKTPMVWSRVSPTETKPVLIVQNQELTQGQIPRLSAEIINNSIGDLSNLFVTAVVYDENENAVAVSQTFVRVLQRGATGQLSFTWPKPFAAGNPTVEIYPRVDLISGAE